MSRLGKLAHRRGGIVTFGVIIALLIGIGATLFGLGVADHALASSNASAWLWSSTKGEVSRVNAETGKVDTRYRVIDAQGHVIQVSQTDRYLVLRDLTTGKVSSLDLATLQISATSQTTAGLGVTVVMSGESAFIIDAVQGVIRQLNPLSLSPIGDPLRFPPGITGGTFDAAGLLWLVVPSQGTVVAVQPAPLKPSKGAALTTASVVRTIPVADPGHDLAMSTLDSGVAVLDDTATTLTTVRGDKVHTVALPLSGAGTLPARSTADNIPVTVVDDRHVYVVNGSQVSSFTVPGSGGPLAPAVPFAGRLYVADNSTGTVFVLDTTGRLVSSIAIRDAGGALELQVRGEHLFINAPDSATARVVDSHNRVKVVDKYANNIPGGDPPPNPPPPPPPKQPSVGPPGAPSSVLASAGNSAAHVSWGAAPANGSTVTRYVVEGDGTTHMVGGGQRSVDITGLVNGQQYRFTVYAVNAKGAGPKRTSNAVVPTSDVPDPPASVAAREQKDGTVTVTWPAANGQGHRIAQYSVTAISAGTQAQIGTAAGTSLVIKAGGLTYGTQYAFTVTAVNDKGANSKTSPVSNTVVPYTVPNAPRSVRARTVDAQGSVQVDWQAAADNGRAITKYLVTAGSSTQTVTGAMTATLTGFGNGATVNVTVKAVNAAGTGAGASATARTIDKPTITAGNPAGPGYNSISVPFTVNGNGGATTCTITVNGGAARGVACTGTTVTGLWPGNTYNYTVTAANKAGSVNFTGSQATPKLSGTVVCTNNGYCGRGSTTGGIWVYTTPTQTGTAAGSVFAPAREQAQCWTTDSKGATIDAQPWGGKKDNRWIRISYSGNNYIPYAWLNLDAAIGTLPHC
jgi:hypothetical protein